MSLQTDMPPEAGEPRVERHEPPAPFSKSYFPDSPFSTIGSAAWQVSDSGALPRNYLGRLHVLPLSRSHLAAPGSHDFVVSQVMPLVGGLGSFTAYVDALLARNVTADAQNKAGFKFWKDQAQHPLVTVVIPARNEADNLQHVLPRIPDWVDEVLLVDGHSTDGTVEVARALRPGIRIVTEKAKGKGAALRTGFEEATGDIVVMLDADGSTDPAEIPAFVGALLAGADFAKGSRFAQGAGSADISFPRQLGNWGLVRLVRLMYGGCYTDLCYGYNAFWKRVLPTLQLDGDGFEIETMMNVRALRAGLVVTEVPSFEAERIHGTSSLHPISDGWRILKTILRERLRPDGRTRQRSGGARKPVIASDGIGRP